MAVDVTLGDTVFTVPDGFALEKVAGPPLLERPITASFDEHGRLYVADSSGSNDPVQKQLAEKPHRIVRLEDRDSDGRFDHSVVFADKMMFPEGTLWHDGSLYVVCGDATGHGMTAGMMVSITKAGLYGIPAIPTDQITNRLNRVIKNIELGTNRMALNVSYFQKSQVQFTSAGMPPAYHCVSSSGKVKEVLQVGLPLGSIQGEHYLQEEYPFDRGDTLVFLSDGLPEAENKSGTMLGYEAVMDCIRDNKDESVEIIKNSLLELGDNWLNGLPLQDDITIVVVKKK